jgi:hypothetical protein
MAELSSKEKAYAVADRFYLERADGSPLNIIRALPATTSTGIVRIIEAFDHSISAVISTMGSLLRLQVPLRIHSCGHRSWAPNAFVP